MGHLTNKKIFAKPTSKTKTRLQINIAAACYLTAICTIGMTSTAYADWFHTETIKTNLIKPLYNFVKDSIGYIAFITGGLGLYLARNMDLWQKGTAFIAGMAITGAGMKVADTFLALPPV